MDDDTFIKAHLKMDETDLNRLRSIVTLRQKFMDACEAFSKAREEACVADSELELAVYGRHYGYRGEEAETARPEDVRTEMTSLHATNLGGGFLLEDETNDGTFLLLGDGPVVNAQLDCDDAQIRGKRELELWLIDYQQMKAILWGFDGEKDEHGYYPYYFAVILDLDGGPGQEVVISTTQGDDDLVPCDRALSYLHPQEQAA